MFKSFPRNRRIKRLERRLESRFFSLLMPVLCLILTLTFEIESQSQTRIRPLIGVSLLLLATRSDSAIVGGPAKTGAAKLSITARWSLFASFPPLLGQRFQSG